MTGPKNKRPRDRASSSNAPGEQGDSWDHVAPWYDSLVSDGGTDFHQAVIIPGVLRLLQLRKGERVLDLGCGQGVVSRAMQRAGAAVTGVDLSPRLIEAARQRSPKEIQFVIGDARRLDFAKDAEFDAAAWVLSAQNMDSIDRAFVECGRVLRVGGRIVVVITHPAFRIPRQSRWRLDEASKQLLREVNVYLNPLKIPIDMKPFKTPKRAITWTYHRPLHAYVNGLAAAGLWVNALEEWASHKASQPGPMARAENRARSEFPLFLAIRAVRVPADWNDAFQPRDV
ncbi:MAG: class I SAM-dependent methyltransferase [Chloroflexi bacterium]|nr:class I SAM-dependent methyltransferase [Chloroflexota bacterium]